MEFLSISVQHGIEKGLQSGCSASSSLSFALGHDQGLGLDRLTDRMRLSFPFGGICHDLLSQVIQVGEVTNRISVAVRPFQCSACEMAYRGDRAPYEWSIVSCRYCKLQNWVAHGLDTGGEVENNAHFERAWGHGVREKGDRRQHESGQSSQHGGMDRVIQLYFSFPW